MTVRFFSILAFWSALLFPALQLFSQTEPRRVDFRKDMQPILAANCVKYHRGDAASAELHLDTPEGLLQGGTSGKAVTPGLAFKMQTSVPGLMDIASEPEAIHELYGTTQGQASYANNCLLARRMVERGVRFVQLTHRRWDMHGATFDEDVVNKTPAACRETDQPSAALIQDLKQRGLLDSTLVIWAGEFGRTPMRQESPYLGRDHHTKAYTIWMAGGGIKPGVVHGASDDFGYTIAENPVSVHDVNATALRPLGIDHKKLTYKFSGRSFRLTDVEGEVIEPLRP